MFLHMPWACAFFKAEGTTLANEEPSHITAAVIANKGGVGRTCSTHNLAGACAENGARVLLVDTDPQCHLSKNCFGTDWPDSLNVHQSIAAIFAKKAEASQVIHQTQIDNIHLIPCSEHFLPFDSAEPHKLKNKSFLLRDFLDALPSPYEYDIVLIDTPPSIYNLPTWSALMAANYVVTPVEPEKNSVEGVLKVKARLTAARENGNPDLTELGYFLTKFNTRRADHYAYAQTLRQAYGAQVFQSVIYLRQPFAKAVTQLLPVTHIRPRKRQEFDMVENLFRELFGRIKTDIEYSQETQNAMEACG